MPSVTARTDLRLDLDQRVLLHGATWDDYERLLAIRGESAAVRITYLRGEVELMSPSSDHEGISTLIGRFVEAFAEERDLPLNGYGSWTIRKKRRGRGAEPDECYVLGTRRPSRPDLAIEVVLGSGGIDKLEVYRVLEVPEVWLWRRHRIGVYLLEADRYRQAARSALLPAIDLALVARLATSRDQTAAVRRFRRTLRDV
jgi:Uma2 family endonuclease